MARERFCRSSYGCIMKIEGVTTRPILFSQLNRNDGDELDGMDPEDHVPIVGVEASPVPPARRVGAKGNGCRP